MSRQQVRNASLKADTARLNLLTNGGFEIWQRGNGPIAGTGGGAIHADRWFLQTPGTSAATATRDTTVVDAGSLASCSCNVTATSTTSSDVANTALLFTQGMFAEVFAAQVGQVMSFSIRVRSSVAGSVVTPVQYANGWIQGTPFTLTAANTWYTMPFTFTVPASMAYVGLAFHAVATFKVDNAMLVVGSVPATYAPLHPAEDLARCQRYYEFLGSPGGNDFVVTGYSSGAGMLWYFPGQYKSVKAASPTVTKVGTWGVQNCGQPAISTIGISGVQIYTTASAAGQFYYQNVSAGNTITVEANP